MKFIRLSNNDGFTILEVMIAIMILTIGILSVAVMQLSSINGNSSAYHLTEASNFVLDQIETIISPSLSIDWDTLDANIPAGLTCPDNICSWNCGPILNPSTQQNYTISSTDTCITDVTASPNNRVVGVNFQIAVNWNEDGRTKTVTMNFSRARD